MKGLRFRRDSFLRGKICKLHGAAVSLIITCVSQHKLDRLTDLWVPTAVNENFPLIATATALRGSSYTGAVSGPSSGSRRRRFCTHLGVSKSCIQVPRHRKWDWGRGLSGGESNTSLTSRPEFWENFKSEFLENNLTHLRVSVIKASRVWRNDIGVVGLI